MNDQMKGQASGEKYMHVFSQKLLWKYLPEGELVLVQNKSPYIQFSAQPYCLYLDTYIVILHIVAIYLSNCMYVEI